MTFLVYSLDVWPQKMQLVCPVKLQDCAYKVNATACDSRCLGTFAGAHERIHCAAVSALVYDDG